MEKLSRQKYTRECREQAKTPREAKQFLAQHGILVRNVHAGGI